MAWYDPRHILALYERGGIPIVVDGTITPILLVIARRGYWVQSRVLRIPDKFGLFSPGPPLLQAHQANRLAVIGTDAVIPVVAAFIMEWVVGPTGWFPISWAVIGLLFTISVYVAEVFYNPMRAPDYDWEALYEKMGLVQPAP